MPAHSAALIQTEELARRIGAPGLRIFDCTVYLKPGPDGRYVAESGRANYDTGHIPGAAFLDLQAELSNPRSKLRFTLPPLDKLTKTFAAKGVGHGTSVVLYSHATPTWATRIWWMLRAIGFDDAAVLDGGLDKWKAEGRAIETGPAKGYPPATFIAKPKPGLFIDRRETQKASTNRSTVVVNALGPQFHKGLEPSRYGRPGRIPGSVNVPAATLIDAASKTFLPPEEVAPKFAAQGITRDKRVVAYCGGGISATIDLFQLHRLGYDHITLYDGSMGEWARDESLPIETG